MSACAFPGNFFHTGSLFISDSRENNWLQLPGTKKKKYKFLKFSIRAIFEEALSGQKSPSSKFQLSQKEDHSHRKAARKKAKKCSAGQWFQFSRDIIYYEIIRENHEQRFEEII